MHKHLHTVRAFARTNPYAVLMGIAMVLVTGLAAVETSGILPLAGQATPMYGPLQSHRATLKKPTARTVRVKPVRRNARSIRASSSRSSSH